MHSMIRTGRNRRVSCLVESLSGLKVASALLLTARDLAHFAERTIAFSPIGTMQVYSDV